MAKSGIIEMFKDAKALVTDLITAPYDAAKYEYQQARRQGASRLSAVGRAAVLPVLVHGGMLGLATVAAQATASSGNRVGAALCYMGSLLGANATIALVGIKTENGLDGPTMQRTKARKAALPSYQRG